MLVGHKNEPEFGKGNSDGVIASEAANSAVTGGALIPMLALSIPGDPIVAVLLGGLIVQGIIPGPTMFINYPDVVNGIFSIFIIGALLLCPIGLVFSRVIVTILKLPSWLISSSVLVISIIGTYSVARQLEDLWLLFVFGILGFFLRKSDYPVAPIVIGFVLGTIFESNLRRSVLVSQGDLFGYVAQRPIALSVIVLTALFFFMPVCRTIFARYRSAKH